MARSEKIIFLDSLRGILMVLGVVLHSAQVFNPAGTWAIHSPLSTPLAGALVDSIHTFRIPTFFIVSGFFSLRSLRRYGGLKFMRFRIKRILVPLVIMALTLNMAQAVVLEPNGLQSFSFSDYWCEGRWVSHLWFLVYLIGYNVVFYLLYLLLSSPSGSSDSRGSDRRCDIGIWLWLLGIPLFYLALVALGKFFPLIYDSHFGKLSIFDSIYYAQFFMFGLCISSREGMFKSFISLKKVPCVLLLVAASVIYHLTATGGSIFMSLSNKYFHTLTVWMGCSVCFGIASTYLNRSQKVLQFFSDASYSIYLFHHILVICLGLLFISFGVGGNGGLLLLILLVLFASSFIHVFAVSRSHILTFLFNGRLAHSPAREPGK